MSTREEAADSSAPEEPSLADNLPSSESMSGVQRSETDGQSDHVVTEPAQTNSHSFPQPLNVVSYGQQTYQPTMSPNTSRPISPHNFSFPNPPEPPVVLPGGSASTSPFIGYAPGFPVQQPYGPPMIAPLPYSASNPYPPPGYTSYGGQQAPMFYSASTTMHPGYGVPNYNQRAHTTGSLVQPLPTHPSATMPSTSYSTGFVGIQSQLPEDHKSPGNQDEEWFNLFWLFCLLGPLTWPCALFGICSDRRNERMAGFVSLILLTLAIVVAAVVLSQASKDSDDGSNGS
eukprot:g4954.t1